MRDEHPSSTHLHRTSGSEENVNTSLRPESGKSHEDITVLSVQQEQFVDLTVNDLQSDDYTKSDTTYLSPSDGTEQEDIFSPPLPQQNIASSSDTTRSTFTSSNEDLSIVCEPEESEMDALLRNICRRKPFPVWYF